MTARIARLDSRALLRVEGPDWRPFLHNLLTQSVADMAAGELRFAALLTPQGRMLHDLFLFADSDGCTLDCAADERGALAKRLALYRLRAQVRIIPISGAVLAAWGEAPAGAGWAPDPRLPALGWRSVSADAPATATEQDYVAHRLDLGVPDSARDRLPDTYPIEANLDLLNGIDFAKGCFIGQETTSRMKRRGVIKTRMLPLTFDGPSPPFGAEVLAGELRAGQVLTSQDGRAMALLRLDRIEAQALTAEGQAVSVGLPPWLAAAPAS